MKNISISGVFDVLITFFSLWRKGESKAQSIAMAANWNDHKNQWTVEPGKFDMMLGGS